MNVKKCKRGRLWNKIISQVSVICLFASMLPPIGASAADSFAARTNDVDIRFGVLADSHIESFHNEKSRSYTSVVSALKVINELSGGKPDALVTVGDLIYNDFGELATEHYDLLNKAFDENMSNVPMIHAMGNHEVTASDYVYFGTLNNGAKIEWKEVDFGNTPRNFKAKFNVGVDKNYQKQAVNLLIDGKQVGQVVLKPTGGWTTWDNMYTVLTEKLSGKHTVAVEYTDFASGSLAGIEFEVIADNTAGISFIKSADKTSVTAKLVSAPIGWIDGKSKVLLAVYNGDSLLGIDNGGLNENLTVYLPADGSVAEPDKNINVKAFIFETMQSIKPLTAAEEYFHGIK